MRVTRWAPRAGVTAAVVLTTLCFGTAATAAQPTSRAEALAQGDPAATAPSFSEATDGYVYEGKPVSGEEIVARELACFAVDKGPSRCYDSAAELQATELGVPAVAARRAHSAPRARMADCSIWAILFAWTGRLGEGAQTAFAETGRWANFGPGINNEVSSFAMGDRAGHFSEDGDGIGYWYPGNTNACVVEDNINRAIPSWNNRISSRYRVP